MRAQNYTILVVSASKDFVVDSTEQIRAGSYFLGAGDLYPCIGAVFGQEPLPTIRGELNETFGCHQIQHCVRIVPQEVFDRYVH